MPQDHPVFIQSDALTQASGIRHAFFTRQGGVSQGIYDSLNCGFGSSDDAACVAENRSRAAAILGVDGEQLLTVYQVHGTDVMVVGGEVPKGTPPKADAMVTDRPGHALGILTADCAPVLFADPAAGVIGAAHAGWRGALDGIVATTVSAMQKLGARPASTIASVGPCIGAIGYEVGPEFPAPFIEMSAENKKFFQDAPRAGHFLFDLAGFVTAQLSAAGVATIDHTGGDTLGAEDRFFSYRRACHRDENDYGRQVSAIALVE